MMNNKYGESARLATACASRDQRIKELREALGIAVCAWEDTAEEGEEAPDWVEIARTALAKRPKQEAAP